MNKRRTENIHNALLIYKNYEKNPKLIEFVEALTQDEVEFYFYYDVHRADLFLRELSLMKGKSISISDIICDTNSKMIIKELIRSEDAVNNLIEYWKAFGCLPKPDTKLRNSVIRKYELLVAELTEKERNFFLEC